MADDYDALKYCIFTTSAYGMVIFRIVIGIHFINMGNPPAFIIGLVLVSHVILLFVGLCMNKPNFLLVYMMIEVLLSVITVIYIIVLELQNELDSSHKQILNKLLPYIISAPMMLGIVYICFKLMYEANDETRPLIPH